MSSLNKELLWLLAGTIGKVGREIRIGRRRRVESERQTAPAAKEEGTM